MHFEPAPNSRGKRRPECGAIPTNAAGARVARCRSGNAAATAGFGRAECLDADLAPIATASIRRPSARQNVRKWIRREADHAAADPIFAVLRFASLKGIANMIGIFS